MSETREVVRIARTDIDGTQTVDKAVTALKGVGDMYANAIAEVLDYKDQVIGDLSDDEIDTVEEAIRNPDEYDIPEWVRNRRKSSTSEDSRRLAPTRDGDTKSVCPSEVRRQSPPSDPVEKSEYQQQRSVLRLQKAAAKAETRNRGG